MNNEVVPALESVISSIQNQLLKKLNSDYEFHERDYYGKGFLIALLSSRDKNKFSDEIKGMAMAIKGQKKDKTFHYEFNRYALLHAFNNENVSEILGGYKYTGTRVANWTLLRALCRIKSNIFIENIKANIEIWFIKKFFTYKETIEDKRCEYTSQYNYFSLALLHELNQQKKVSISDRWLKEAVNLAILQINEHGIANVLGRGALQSFGFSSLIYLLSFYSHDKKVFAKIKLLIKFMQSQMIGDNLPLVLCKSFEEHYSYVGKPDLTDEAFLGWYSYNNLTDYQAFSALMLQKAKENISRTTDNLSCEFRFPITQFVEVARDLYLFRTELYHCYFGGKKFDSTCLQVFNPIITANSIILPPVGGEASSKSLNNQSEFCYPVFYNNQTKLALPECVSVLNVSSNIVEVKLRYAEGLSYSRTLICEADRVKISDKIINSGEKDWVGHVYKVASEKDLECNNAEKSIIYSTISKLELSYKKVEIRKDKFTSIDMEIKIK